MNRIKILIYACMFPLIVLIGCGASDDGRTASAQPVQIDTNPTIILCPFDSIGIESGDSNYVMGGVEGVAFGPDGNIAVLDCGRSTVRIYSPEGEYLRSIGRRGNGPGELQNIAFEVNGDEITLPVSISMYETGNDEPLVTYYEEIFPFDPTDDVGLLELDWYGYDIAAGADGTIFIAPRSTEEALIIVCDSAGNEIRTLQLPYEPTERTEEELEMERNILRAKAIASNESPEDLEPDPFKPMIRGIETDGDGNLWVLQGGPSTPTFTVISSEGDFLFTAIVTPEPPDGSTWRFHIDENGFLAYAEDPFCGFYKIYILEMRDR